MTVVDKVENEEFRETKYPKFRVATGGKEPPSGPTGPTVNWIKELPVGAVFACRANVNTVDWEMYYLVHKFERIYLLKIEAPDGKVWERRVEPILFCKHYKDYELIAIQAIEEQKALEGDGNGDSNRTD